MASLARPVSLSLVMLGLSVSASLMFASLTWPHQWLYAQVARWATLDNFAAPTVLLAAALWWGWHAIVLLVDRWQPTIALLMVVVPAVFFHPAYGLMVGLVFWEYARATAAPEAGAG